MSSEKPQMNPVGIQDPRDPLTQDEPAAKEEIVTAFQKDGRDQTDGATG